MGSFYMEATQINYRRDETIKTVDQKLQELSENSAIDTDIAPVFKSIKTYAPGDMVYYRNKLYVFNVEHTGSWAAADVTATDVTTTMNAGFSTLKSGLTTLDNEVNGDATVYPYADVITIPDAVPSNLANCKVKIEPVQSGSGDPSPTNIRPITGHTEASVQRVGKNRLSVNSYSGSGLWLSSTTIAVTGNYLYRQANFTTTGGKYTFNTFGIKNGVETAIDISENVGDLSRYNDVSAYDYIRVSGYSNNASNVLSDVMLCFNDNNTDTIAYEPYAGQTYTIALGDTIYGGTVDFDSGVMTVDRAYAELNGTENWTAQGNGNRVYTDAVISAIKHASASGTVENILCNQYVATSSTNTYNGVMGISVNTQGYVEVADGVGGMDATTWKAALSSNPLQIVYELATPTTIQLTPQQIQLLKGQNTLTASTGQISVTVNGVSGAIGSLQTQANATDEAVAKLAADIAEQLPTAPTTDGAYVLTVTVADGTPTYSWESAS